MEKVDMSLDDIIKQKQVGTNGRRGGDSVTVTTCTILLTLQYMTEGLSLNILGWFPAVQCPVPRHAGLLPVRQAGPLRPRVSQHGG